MAMEPSDTIAVKALLLGERLDTRALEGRAALATAPLTLRLEEGGTAVLFRYGAIVLFNADAAAADAFVRSIAPCIIQPFPRPEEDEIRLRLQPGGEDSVELTGTIVLRDLAPERLQALADILAKSLALAHYETRIGSLFDRIEPLALTLRERGRPGAHGRELMRQIGDVLLTQQFMVGRVETGEKPDLLWDHPELERGYARFAEWYELRDRDRALDRKLEVISRTAETLLELVQTRSSMRVEWYVVALIVAELVISIYPALVAR